MQIMRPRLTVEVSDRLFCGLEAEMPQENITPASSFGLQQRWVPLLLLAQSPSLIYFAMQSSSNPLLTSFPFALAGVCWLTMRHFCSRQESWRPEHLLLVCGNVLFFTLAMLRGSAWLACLGACMSVLAWTLSRRLWIPMRTVVAVAILLALLVRMPPFLQSTLESRWNLTTAQHSSEILHSAGIYHLSDAMGFHLVGRVFDDRYFRSGAASPWLLLLVCTAFTMVLRRSVVHTLLLLSLTLAISFVCGIGSTVLGIMLSDWTGINFSSGAAGIFWRMDWFAVGIAMVWCLDHIVLLLCSPIPEMAETVTGRRVPRGGVDEFPDDPSERLSGNRFTDLWNQWIAPLPPVFQIASLAPLEIPAEQIEAAAVTIENEESVRNGHTGLFALATVVF